MADELRKQYLAALDLLNISELADSSERGYSTIMAYKKGTRRITGDAAKELIAFLRHRAATLTQAAESLDAALRKEDNSG